MSNRRRAPAFAEQGEPGEEHWLNLELKLAADVALVGFPNAGKSTFVSRISAAKPKIGDYPFTTLEPHLGVVRVGRGASETEFVVADVPGLVEGAAEGRGLGHRFLRHVERSRVLLVMADLAAADGRAPAEQVDVLVDELRRYRPELLDRPRVVIGTKADLCPPGDRETAAGELELCISAVTGDGLDELVGRLAALVGEARRSEPEGAAGIVLHRPAGEGVEVRRADDGSFVVAGRAALRAVALSDLTNDDAVDYVQHRLRRLGVDRSLARAGARDGDVVHLGPLSFTYYRDGDALGPGADDANAPRPSRRRPKASGS